MPCNFLTSELQKVVRTCGVWQILTCSFAAAACHFSRSELQKLVRACGVLCILTCKCASRHSGVQFFDIVPSKIAPELRCFVRVDLKMRFATQRRAIFCFSAEQLPPHQPLYRAYFSNIRNHESLKKHSDSKLS